MEKPVPKHIADPTLHWNDVSDYLSEVLGKNLRNYAGTKYTGLDDDPPYQDFWHHILDSDGGISNGSFFILGVSMNEDYVWDKSKRWIGEIYDAIAEHFPEQVDEEGVITFWVEW